MYAKPWQQNYSGRRKCWGRSCKCMGVQVSSKESWWGRAKTVETPEQELNTCSQNAFKKGKKQINQLRCWFNVSTQNWLHDSNIEVTKILDLCVKWWSHNLVRVDFKTGKRRNEGSTKMSNSKSLSQKNSATGAAEREFEVKGFI